jgi:biotin transporter BioY
MPFMFVVNTVTPLLVATIAGQPLMMLLGTVWLSVTSCCEMKRGENRENI